MLKNDTYTTKATAVRGARRKQIKNVAIVETKTGRFEIQDRDRPIYNHAKRKKSSVTSPVAMVWDICCNNTGAKRKDIIDMAVNAGIAINTAKSQYQAWRQASGLVKGRK